MMQLYGRHRFFLLIFLAFFLAHWSNAQQLRYAFKNYTPNDGLPSSEVHKVLQDARHYMWFATDHGVCRFNGYEFKTYNLADNSILGFYEDYKKRIWAWSFSGRLFVFENEKFEEYKWNKKLMALTQPGIIQSFYVDTDDNLFVASSGPHSYKITKNGDAIDLIKIRPSSKIIMAQAEQGHFFTYISEYPIRYNEGPKLPEISTFVNIQMNKRTYHVEVPVVVVPERFKIRQISDSEVVILLREFQVDLNLRNGNYQTKKLNLIVYDAANVDGNKYYATEDGLVIENSRSEIVATYLKGIHLVSILKDMEGGLWLTSLNSGVFYLQPSRIAHLSKNNEILKKKFSALYQLQDKTLLAGFSDGEVVRFKPHSLWQNFNLDLESVNSFYEDTSKVIFVGGVISNILRDGSFFARTVNGQTFQTIIGLSNFVKQNGNIYIGITNNIVKLNSKNKEGFELITQESFRASRLFVNNKGDMLVGNVFGLWYYRNGRIVPYDSTKPLFSSRVTDIAKFNGGQLLVGTRGKGLLIEDADSLIQLTENTGLISNNIRRILVDEDNVWVASNKGISILRFTSYAPLRFSINNINASDGLLSNEVNELITYNDYVIAGTNTGASFLSKKAFIGKSYEPLPLYVSSIRIGEQISSEEALLDVSSFKRNLIVRYEALSYSNVGKLNYRYRLAGFDSTWFYTNNLEIQFNPLPYGKYRLEIQAKREFEHWSDRVATVSLSIQCKAPLWKTPVFWAILTMLLIAAIFFYYKKREKEISKRQQEKELLQHRISETEQLALKSQMNPHFIFNSLNSIQQYVIDRDVQGANSFISGFSKLMRQTLDFSSKEKITLEEEIGYLKNYLELERMRMESKFDFTITVDAVSPAAELRLPPLMLQPYVENALRHGVRYLKDKNGHIQLSFIERNAVLECIVEDNGIGRDKAGKLKAVNPIEYQSRGMSLTAERVELLNRNADRKIVIIVKDLTNESGEACGTSVSVKFPV
ncbi:hypothetical protein ESA94_04265 [Lacibacter luteus]|uniref:Signal transduction histidine kinase internal region domain-containing protein n=1 Tax=Lacibacter luteus TaxID=2508719 RepID=A0A4V1M811_9BACT|nr:sensor histidine kinase [Lacibacter luteus]RXK62232.1 hypothetical protein ESA94_04265 [Lacibacter luteus]